MDTFFFVLLIIVNIILLLVQIMCWVLVRAIGKQILKDVPELNARLEKECDGKKVKRRITEFAVKVIISGIHVLVFAELLAVQIGSWVIYLNKR